MNHSKRGGIWYSMALVAAMAVAGMPAAADSPGAYGGQDWVAMSIDMADSMPLRPELAKEAKIDPRTIPMSHWRPWFLPRESHPYNGRANDRRTEPTPRVLIKPVAARK